jgi:hypothetical protein
VMQSAPLWLLIRTRIAVAMTTSVDNDEKIYERQWRKGGTIEVKRQIQKGTCRYWSGSVINLSW